LLERGGRPPIPVRVVVVQGVVALTVGYERGEDAIAGEVVAHVNEAGPAGATRSLAVDPTFQKTMAQVDKDAAVTVYFDGQRLLKQIEELPSADPGFKENWPKIRDALGLNGLQAAAWTSGFDGKDWGSRAFIAAPEPRAGLLKMLGGK